LLKKIKRTKALVFWKNGAYLYRRNEMDSGRTNCEDIEALRGAGILLSISFVTKKGDKTI